MRKIINLIFVIQKKLEFGQVFYIVGNIEEFGNLDVNKGIKMKWESDHYWIAEVSLKVKKYILKQIQYKYVIAEDNWPINPIWENTERIIACGQLVNKKKHTIKDYWDQRQFKLRLPVILDDYQLDISEYTMKVLGDIPELGHISKQPLKMYITEIRTGINTFKKVWEITFQIPTSIEYFVYHYIMCFPNGRINFSERNSENICIMFDANKVSGFIYHQNVYKKTDECFNKEFDVIRLSPKIFVGPYPVLSADFARLNVNNIKSAICLMTENELEILNGTQESYSRLFNKFSIKLYHKAFDLASNQKELKCAIKNSKKYINKCLNKYGNVYVFSQYGRDRPPKVVLSYFYFYESSKSFKKIMQNSKQKQPKFDRKSQIGLITMENDLEAMINNDDSESKISDQSNFFSKPKKQQVQSNKKRQNQSENMKMKKWVISKKC